MRECANGDVKSFRHRIHRPIDQHDFEFQPGVLRLEGAECIGEPGNGQRGGGLDAEMIDQVMVLFAHARQEIADVGHHAARAMQISLTCFRQSQLAG